MSKNSIREDKTCLNCYHVAEKRFCPNCGQENIETRKTFYELFVHFFEDLTHYENAFWKTIRNLIFKPAALTREYLSGKRMSYLAPFRLYIFISFVTFFLISILPEEDKTVLNINETKETVVVDTISIGNPSKVETSRAIDVMGFKSVAQLDSLQQFGPESDKLSPSIYWLTRKAINVVEHNSSAEITAKFSESFFRNLPKVLFIYMPIFALVLWIFQSKKKYYYFDHGIFTLHYFSFLLLLILFLTIIDRILSLFGDEGLPGFISGVIILVGVVYMIYYFFPAHHRFYQETRAMSILKGIVMFIINMFFIFLILLLFALYTFLNIH